MLLIITTERSFPEVEDYLLSIGLEFNPQPTATMFNEKTGKLLVWIKLTCWGRPLRLDETPLHITKREPHSCHVLI